MMSWLIPLIGAVICLAVILVGVWIAYDDHKYWDEVKSRNSTSESELRNPYKRNQWG